MNRESDRNVRRRSCKKAFRKKHEVKKIEKDHTIGFNFNKEARIFPFIAPSYPKEVASVQVVEDADRASQQVLSRWRVIKVAVGQCPLT